MLKAEDRAEVCEFMYWLGCIQNHGTPLMKDIEPDSKVKEDVSLLIHYKTSYSKSYLTYNMYQRVNGNIFKINLKKGNQLMGEQYL